MAAGQDDWRRKHGQGQVGQESGDRRAGMCFAFLPHKGGARIRRDARGMDFLMCTVSTENFRRLGILQAQFFRLHPLMGLSGPGAKGQKAACSDESGNLARYWFCFSSLLTDDVGCDQNRAAAIHRRTSNRRREGTSRSLKGDSHRPRGRHRQFRQPPLHLRHERLRSHTLPLVHAL